MWSNSCHMKVLSVGYHLPTISRLAVICATKKLIIAHLALVVREVKMIQLLSHESLVSWIPLANYVKTCSHLCNKKNLLLLLLPAPVTWKSCQLAISAMTQLCESHTVRRQELLIIKDSWKLWLWWENKETKNRLLIRGEICRDRRSRKISAGGIVFSAKTQNRSAVTFA